MFRRHVYQAPRIACTGPQKTSMYALVLFLLVSVLPDRTGSVYSLYVHQSVRLSRPIRFRSMSLCSHTSRVSQALTFSTESAQMLMRASLPTRFALKTMRVRVLWFILFCFFIVHCGCHCKFHSSRSFLFYLFIIFHSHFLFDQQVLWRIAENNIRLA